MTNGTGKLSSVLQDDQFGNYIFDYLPVGETDSGNPKTVATIYFETDQPLERVRNEGKPFPKDLVVNPGDYLDAGAKGVLEDLLKPIDGGRGGQPTNDRLKRLPGDAGKLGKPYLEAFHRLTYVTWRFEAFADPREPTDYNVNLSMARGLAVGAYLVKYLWDGFEGQYASTENVLKALVKLVSDSSYGVKTFRAYYTANVDNEDAWRSESALSIWSHLVSGSRFAGDSGLDPGDIPESEYPQKRRVDVMANSLIGSGDHDWRTKCSTFAKEPKYFDADPDDVLPSVIEPGLLYDFKPSNQINEEWDYTRDPDEETPKGKYNMLYQFRREMDAHLERKQRGEIGQKEFLRELTKVLYGFRYVRMIQHELLRGNVPPTAGVGPGWVNPGTTPSARAALCGGGVYGLRRVWDDMIPNDLGQYIFGGNVVDNTRGIKQARQIAHQYHVRVDPWYRAAFMKEIPGASPEDSWLDSDTVATPPDEVDLWPEQDSLANLPKNIRQHLNPKKWGDADLVGDEADYAWKNGIPKALGTDATHGPAGYMSGEEHYRWLATNGHYDYGDLSFLSAGSVVKDTWKQRLPQLYAEKNDYDANRSYVQNIRDAVKEAMILMDGYLSDADYKAYLKQERGGYPDYANDWHTWEDPLQDPYLEQ